MKTLVIGGARSGKSRAAEGLLTGRDDVTYVATAYSPGDDVEWQERVRIHQERRPAEWATVETTDLVTLLGVDGGPLLIDCLTLWLTRTMDHAGAWADEPTAAVAAVEAAGDRLVAALRATSRDVVLVTNEVGQGVVPATPSGRRFRDQMGLLNTAVADVCEDVLWCIAGRVVRL
ncbi:bifunctional adenosylcobinamide kinase/adenosylcobinamide-phosphate guanylyltransferase [Nocardioides speluncae]|uniref:bifunctional adenosylcobinamide kinase/adenosylcobinamide-phosphate guanylyltransferase n=1 Tax=Nocardioides speluncae TaxID=2670337 RepID=UPI000D6997FD|nr:bifunctional adenosylcobinamide kinase/adenosylcobinamide-phosphate guanylyltransferase [Nocardioides speluncae]